MGKRKKRDALFDVITGKNATGLKVPSWFKPSPAHAEPDQADRSRIQLKQPPGFDRAATSPAEAPPAAPPQAAERVAAIEGGHLRLKLNYPTCVALGLGLVVLLFGFYKLGQASAPKSPPADGEQASLAMGGALDGGDTARQDDRQSMLRDVVGRWNAGGKFLVIQGKVQSMADAEAIQEYLWKNGFMPSICKDDNGTLMVVDARDQSKASDTELGANVENLTRLGANRDWRLRQKYNFKHVGEPWTITVPPNTE